MILAEANVIFLMFQHCYCDPSCAEQVLDDRDTCKPRALFNCSIWAIRLKIIACPLIFNMLGIWVKAQILGLYQVWVQASL